MPPMDPGGDVRVGYFVAGGLLIFLGWVLGVITNVLVHAEAGSAGRALGWMRVTTTLGPYAWAVLAFGVVTGGIGVVLLALGWTAPRGKLVLPGYDY